MDWSSPPADFRFIPDGMRSAILFERHSPTENAARFYWLGWQPSLIDDGAVVRLYGRKGGHQRMLTPQPFSSLEDAWPLIRATVKTRLRHGYRVIEPAHYRPPQIPDPSHQLLQFE